MNNMQVLENVSFLLLELKVMSLFLILKVYSYILDMFFKDSFECPLFEV